MLVTTICVMEPRLQDGIDGLIEWRAIRRTFGAMVRNLKKDVSDSLKRSDLFRALT